jgi:hypothetical protein
MSTQDIIAELPRLTRPELEAVHTKVRELLMSSGQATTSWGEALLALAGSAHELPADFAHQHDHYLHGTPRR